MPAVVSVGDDVTKSMVAPGATAPAHWTSRSDSVSLPLKPGSGPFKIMFLLEKFCGSPNRFDCLPGSVDLWVGSKERRRIVNGREVSRRKRKEAAPVPWWCEEGLYLTGSPRTKKGADGKNMRYWTKTVEGNHPSHNGSDCSGNLRIASVCNVFYATDKIAMNLRAKRVSYARDSA